MCYNAYVGGAARTNRGSALNRTDHLPSRSQTLMVKIIAPQKPESVNILTYGMFLAIILVANIEY